MRLGRRGRASAADRARRMGRPAPPPAAGRDPGIPAPPMHGRRLRIPDRRNQTPDHIMIRDHGWETDCLELPRFRPAWLLAGLVLFGIGFGFVEAAVVVDLYAISSLADRWADSAWGEVSPLTALGRLGRAGPSTGRLLRIETFREAATLVLLIGVGVAA